jgi:sortase A
MGALLLLMPALILCAQMPRTPQAAGVESLAQDTDMFDRASAYDNRLLQDPTIATGEAPDPFTDSPQPAYESDTDYQSQLGMGDSMASIRIPKIGVDLNIGHGTGAGTLTHGAGHVYGTTLPVGDPGNSVIAAHRGLGVSLLFYRLGELGVGDMVYTQAGARSVAWRVVRILRVDPGSMQEHEALQADASHTLLTLYTCDPPGLNTRRLLVVCERVPWVDAVSVPGQVDWGQGVLAGGLAGVLALGFMLVSVRAGVPMRHARRR